MSAVMACKVCGELKKPESFALEQRATAPYRRRTCNACRSAYNKARSRRYPRMVFYDCIKHMRRADPQFDLTVRDLREMWEAQQGRCSMSGVSMTWGMTRIQPTSISVDRVNPNAGYRKGNVRFVCYGLNTLKMRGTDEEAFRLALAFCFHYRANNPNP